MSRIGRRPIKIPRNINTHINNSTILIQGPKGELSYELSDSIEIEKTESKIQLYPIKDSENLQAIYGLSRTIINNMVIGVSQGFQKQLEIHGVGYRSQMDGKNLILHIGYSHPVIIKPPEKILISIENTTQIIISGIDKEVVGQVAAKIRSVRPPEPYKGKGIRYREEKIRRKIGKAGK